MKRAEVQCIYIVYTYIYVYDVAYTPKKWIAGKNQSVYIRVFTYLRKYMTNIKSKHLYVLNGKVGSKIFYMYIFQYWFDCYLIIHSYRHKVFSFFEYNDFFM